jgi:hypothetical protein
MGCSYSKSQIKNKWQRKDLCIDIPNNYGYIIKIIQPKSYINPELILYNTGIVKKTFPNNTWGKYRFLNEIKIYKYLAKLSFIINIFDIDFVQNSFSMRYLPDNMYKNMNISYITKYLYEYNIHLPGNKSVIDYIKSDGCNVYIVGLSFLKIKEN